MGDRPRRLREANKGMSSLVYLSLLPAHTNPHLPLTPTAPDPLRRRPLLQPRPQRRQSRLPPPLHPHLRVHHPKGREQVGPRLRPPLDPYADDHPRPGLHAARGHCARHGGPVSADVSRLDDVERHVDCHGLCHLCASATVGDKVEVKEEAEDRHCADVLPRLLVSGPSLPI